MAADLESLIQQVQTLDVADLWRLREVIDARIGQVSPLANEAELEEEFKRRLLDAGLLKEIKPPIRDYEPFRNRKPVPIQGKPLSETIIEERR